MKRLATILLTVAALAIGSTVIANDTTARNRDAAKQSRSLTLAAKDFIDQAKGYYLDKGKWLAIHPEKHKEATAEAGLRAATGRKVIAHRRVLTKLLE